ncbi:MAG: AsmA-like C-terminal domain-containing protein [Rhodospirillales bacterium]|nr:AsmA-like C-terminal domain-containing protein [Rhodospirillales bacterium]
MGRLVHLFVRLLAGTVAIIVVLLALITLRLSVGPVSLGALAPGLARMLEGATPYRFEIGDLGILWQDWQRGLLVQLEGVRVRGDDGAEYARIDDVAVGFSAAALAHVVIAPSSIEAHGVAITLPPAAPASSGQSVRSLDDLLGGLRGPRDPAHPLSYLDLARLRDVRVYYRPSGDGGQGGAGDWQLSVTQADVQRDEERRLGGTVAMAVIRDDEQAQATAVLAPAPATGDLALTLSLSGLRPALFADVAPALAPLAMLDLPLQGSVELRVGAEGHLAAAAIDLTGTNGALNLTGPLAEDAGLAPPEQHLALRQMALRAAFDSAADTVTVDTFSIGFAPGTTLFVPVPVDFRFPVAELAGSGVFRAGHLTIQALDVVLDGLQARVAVEVEDLLGAPSGKLTVTANDVHVNDFRRFWPPSMAPGGWKWCTQHLHDGIVPRVDATVDFASRDKKIEVTALDARLDVRRLRVDYLPPMPAVTNAAGTVTADLTSLRVDIDAGDAAGLNVGDGFVLISDFDQKDQRIDIDLAISGPVRSAMTIISAQPLDYDSKIGIDPQQTSGEVTTRLMMNFPLVDDLDADQVRIDADVELRNLGITQVVNGVDIADGNARLRIDNRGLRAAGRLGIAGIDGELRVSDSFVDDVEPRTMATFSFTDAPVERIRHALRGVADLRPYLREGALSGRVTFDQSNAGIGMVDATMDLTRASLALPPGGWSKPAGKAGTWEAALRIEKGRLAGVPQFDLLAPGLDVAASCRFGSDGGVDSAELTRLIIGRTNLKGALAARTGGGWDATVSGIALDLQPILDSLADRKDADRERQDALPEITLAADFETVWLKDAEPLRTVRATAVQRNGRLELARLQGEFLDESPVEVSLAPDDAGGRVLHVTAANAGEALRAFRIFPDARGGSLEARARFDDTHPASPLSGKVVVRRFHVVNTPILARLLSILAVTGIRDALTGRGIAFNVFDMPFTYSRDILEITDGKAAGWSLGMTFAGTVDVAAETVDVSGRLVPFYTINNILGRLPLLGSVMTGGERGAGVFSAAYSVKGPLDDPAVSVNPVSVLFPGFLRWLLEALSNWSGGGVETITNDLGVASP